jgi:ParB-like chromosome segregation protein Spo0J
MKLSDIRPNPENPRVIRDDRFRRLVHSIRSFPEMMALRPMVIDEHGVVLGGNMRLRALQQLGYTEIPDDWVRSAWDLTPEQKREFVIKDNVGFGDWDWDELANSWDEIQLAEWGLDVWQPEPEAEEREQDIQALVTFDDEDARKAALKALEGIKGVKKIREKG